MFVRLWACFFFKKSRTITKFTRARIESTSVIWGLKVGRRKLQNYVGKRIPMINEEAFHPPVACLSAILPRKSTQPLVTRDSMLLSSPYKIPFSESHTFHSTGYFFGLNFFSRKGTQQVLQERKNITTGLSRLPSIVFLLNTKRKYLCRLRSLL